MNYDKQGKTDWLKDLVNFESCVAERNQVRCSYPTMMPFRPFWVSAGDRKNKTSVKQIWERWTNQQKQLGTFLLVRGVPLEVDLRKRSLHFAQNDGRG